MNYYEILEVSQNASYEIIKMAYKVMVKKYHPDSNIGDKPNAEEKMKEINEAYSVLSNKNKREAYDRTLKSKFNDLSSSYHNNNRATYNFSEEDRDNLNEENIEVYDQKIRMEYLFKVITTIISLCLVIFPLFSDFQLLDLIVWVLPILFFGTIPGLSADATFTKNKIGIFILQIAMPLCGYLAAFIFKDLNGFLISLLFLTMVYGGGGVCFVIGAHLIDL